MKCQALCSRGKMLLFFCRKNYRCYRYIFKGNHFDLKVLASYFNGTTRKRKKILLVGGILVANKSLFLFNT